jgi:AcrR family transcriptional regulator
MAQRLLRCAGLDYVESLPTANLLWQAGKNLTVLKKDATVGLMARPSPSAQSRRDRRKQETVTDIKATALQQLADDGPAGISMRAIARDLSMTASAVHYYFPSRQALIDALIIDGFHSLARALRSAHDQTAARSPNERWLAVCRAHRAWALQHPAEYLLIYGRTGGSARRVNPQAIEAMGNAVAVLFACMRDCTGHGDIDIERIEAATPAPVREQFAAWRAATDGIGDLPDGALAACMLSYSRLHGAITLELAGHLPPQLTDHSALFDMQMAHTATALHPPDMGAPGP